MLLPDKLTIKDIYNVFYFAPKREIGEVTVYEKTGCRYELIYRLKGEIISEFEGKKVRHAENSIELLPKTKENVNYSVTTLQPGSCIDIFFDTDYPLSDQILCIDCTETGELGLLFKEINQIWFRKEPDYYYQAMSVLYRILGKLALLNSHTASYDPHLKKIRSSVEYLNTHFCDKDLNYDNIAEMSGMSYSYFRRLFEKCMGMPPARYVTVKRIEYAKDLLSSGLYQVQEVAELTGYSNVYYFSRSFKNNTGHSPGKYR